jgi:hypothetical protein
MTPEQLEKKRETARKNGAKSRGPVTAAGKFAARQNSLRHGRFVDRSLLPPNYVVLSVEVQEGFAQELKDNTRQFQVATETQAKIVRQLTAELWMYNRLGAMLCALDEKNYDKAFREFPDYSNFVKSAIAAHNATETDQVHRLIERRRAGHLKAWKTFVTTITHLQKHHGDAMRDPEVRNPVQAEAQLEAEAELWNEPIEQNSQPFEKKDNNQNRPPAPVVSSPAVLTCASAKPIRKSVVSTPTGSRETGAPAGHQPKTPPAVL